MNRYAKHATTAATPGSAGPHAEPSRNAVQAALRTTTETLARELAQPHVLAPEWSEFEWRVGRAVATMHGISPLLSLVLRWQGPAGWAQFLIEQREHTAQRYERTRELLLLIEERARACGLGLIALKGAALHAIGLYAPGERPMADVDLLTREEDSPRAGRMLETLGFRETYATWKHRVFEPNEPRAAAAFGEHAANAMKIELHTRIREILPLHAVDVSEQLFAGALRPGLNGYPSQTALMSHLLLHAAGAMAFRALRLINVHDIARLSALMTEQDWDEFLFQGNARDGKLWWAFPPLSLTARYYHSIPERILARVASGCPWLLRQTCRRRSLTDVSFSHLWISAFPGIEWAASVREMLAYAGRRLVPSAEVRAGREVVARTQPFAAEDPWMRLSQSGRILRWLAARQVRAETLRPVRMALEGVP
jgi:Uncharacterised nucleotidyltransferase